MNTRQAAKSLPCATKTIFPPQSEKRYAGRIPPETYLLVWVHGITFAGGHNISAWLCNRLVIHFKQCLCQAVDGGVPAVIVLVGVETRVGKALSHGYGLVGFPLIVGCRGGGRLRAAGAQREYHGEGKDQRKYFFYFSPLFIKRRA